MPYDFATQLSLFGPTSTWSKPDEAFARRYCAWLTQAHYENFTVASLFLPRRYLQDFQAIYAWCRWADDLADETGGGQRALDLLSWWRDQLQLCYEGIPQHPVMVALRPTILRKEIPPQPFLDLLKAFELDQFVTRYRTFDELQGYCRHSANPVGRLVLYVAKCHDAERGLLSDHICTGLQLANFWQDIARDYDIGRVYLPEEDRQRFRYPDEDLQHRRFTENFVELLKFQIARTYDFFHQGTPLINLVSRDISVEVDLFLRGGKAILRSIETQGYNVWQARPRLNK